ncbi:MAG TPA: tetratricopeptide repeat protein [Casimicrobiaceae bacterium]
MYASQGQEFKRRESSGGRVRSYNDCGKLREGGSLAEIDRLYQTGIEQMTAGDLQASIATFTRIIELRPDFAEGWNKRATLYFLTGELRKSLADCDEVVKRNPYHFGALAGYAQIYTRLQYYERALDYARRALAVNPNLEAVRRNVELLEHLLEQRRNQTI